ncbi:threonine dehydratase [Defluviimonas sp. 20V17]|uniref:Hydroxyectoine utilization dehydratase EutB n=1 Tax=Allgaiera indica TaxID=765699 RepID=A0AAN4UPH0_9RHOB|nr:hydroxyectoine utilization dehydratase EutB [Allgaiera indica]KDB03868.1 threonine dehydratase [Defluviimonas sp. 20V17]GHE00112.1 hydroxyectoine utilization dehydratase EutB [Allgaiera indica]SDW37006.1 threonine dehydratase [Allgaiera indica]
MTFQTGVPCLADVLAAAQRILGIAARTPLVPSPFLTDRLGADFLLKLEIAQPIGAFKLRGAANAIAAVPDGAPGVVCCSTGNHGRAVAHAAARRGLRAVVCLSALVPEAKLAGIRTLGAELRIVGRSQDDAQAEATRLMAEAGLAEIPPFDDPAVIAGQGTLGLEILAERPDIGTLLVPLSGGGLAAGVALAAKAIKPDVRVIGVSMDRGAAMAASIAAGRPVAVQEVASLADSLGGGIGLDNRLSFALCRDLLDAVVLVTEEEIYRALQALFHEDRLVAEGAAVVGIAALLSGKLAGQLDAGAPVATILTGRNLDMGVLARIVTGADVELDGKIVKGAPWRRT